MSGPRYFVQDDPPAGVKLESSDDARVLEVLRKVYPDLRETTEAEYRAAEREDDMRSEVQP